MNNHETPPDDPLGHLPDALRERLRRELPDLPVLAVARHDLDAQGRYDEGWLVLSEGRLGAFRRRDGTWDGAWRALEGLASARIVEGLGMNILRLSSADRVAAEYRFTLRHAREVARLQRRLERRIEGKEDTEPPPEKGTPEEKKVRCEKCQRVIPPWSEVCPACLSNRKVLSRLLDFVKPYKWRALSGGLLALAATLAALARPYLTRPMLDEGLGASPQHTASYDVLMRYILLLAGLTIASAACEALRQRLMATLGSRMGRDIRDRTYEHLHKLSLGFFAKRPTGTLVSRITSDSDRIWDFVAFTLVEVVIAFLTIVGVGVALFVLNWRLACIVLLPIPFMLTMMVFFHKRLHRGFDRLFHRWSQLTAVISDALPGVRVIKAFSQEEREVGRFGRINSSFYDGEVGMINLWTLFGPMMFFCSQVGTMLVWIVGGWWTVRDMITPPPPGHPAMSVGTLMAFIGYMWMFYGPIHMVAHMDRMFNRAASSVQRIFEVLDTEPTIFSKTGAHRAADLRGGIRLEDVSFSYDGVRKVLQNVTLDIPAGRMIGLAGPSGGGKTTLVNLICRFYDVLEGRILVDGVDVRDYDVHTLRRRVGVVLQEPFLFHGTVASNIAYGNEDASIDGIIAASKAANAHDFIVGFPDGYDTLVGERGQTLSGGERQRISIARAILNNPRILILDEATSSVDTETERLIQEALDRLIANRTTIAIAHRLSTLRKADRLVVLDKGKVVEEGSHSELSVKEGGTYAKLLNMQNQMQAIMAIGG